MSIPEKGSQVNFNLQAGAGLSYIVLPTTSINVTYRFQHISNAGTAQPNKGTDGGLNEYPNSRVRRNPRDRMACRHGRRVALHQRGTWSPCAPDVRADRCGHSALGSLSGFLDLCPGHRRLPCSLNTVAYRLAARSNEPCGHEAIVPCWVEAPTIPEGRTGTSTISAAGYDFCCSEPILPRLLTTGMTRTTEIGYGTYRPFEANGVTDNEGAAWSGRRTLRGATELSC